MDVSRERTEAAIRRVVETLRMRGWSSDDALSDLLYAAGLLEVFLRQQKHIGAVWRMIIRMHAEPITEGRLRAILEQHGLHAITNDVPPYPRLAPCLAVAHLLMEMGYPDIG